VACEALEVIGRVARQRDLEAAEGAFARAADLASAHGLRLWRLRALHELGTIDQLRTESVDRLLEARELAVAQGALALTATLDLQIAAGLNKQFRADEALEAARRSVDAARRFRLAVLPMALIFQATAHAIRGEHGPMEAMIAEAVALAPEDQDVLGCAWGHCRATFSLLAEDPGEAHAQMATGAALILSSPATIAPPFLGLWPLLGAALDRDAGDATARVRAAHGTRHLVVAALLGYAAPSGPAGAASGRRPVRRSPPRTPRWDRWWPGTGSTPAGSPPRRRSPTAGVTRSHGCARPRPTSRHAATSGWRPPAAGCCAGPGRRCRGGDPARENCPARCGRWA